MTDIDKHIGAQLRARRKYMNLTLTQVATRMGMTLQNVSKYERGTSCISAARLYALSRVLKVHPAFFYEGLFDA